ncbi:sensor histidine kinase [Paenibacillus macquariensis]|nr:HAMP domain-containing sensor histidine kinase [Paenibacillus macquariensis]MEC0089491.1 HAMP domain-containing sensor histidine kinase [Paenibacillus macquariensis]OAB25835.1 two-component sensor histidine kinase [Paenibacillus macquariensis subsp. macquariensis]
MSKLSRKLFWRIACMICLVFAVSFLVNTFFLPKYILYQQKVNLAQLTNFMSNETVESLIQTEGELEQQYNVTIVSTEFVKNPNVLNDVIRTELNRKGITLAKFWVMEERIQDLEHGKTVYNLYSQKKLNTSFLVTIFRKDNMVFVVGDSIAHTDQSIRAVNKFNLYIAIGAMFLTLGLAWLIARQIIRPIKELANNAEDISNLKFRTTNIKTGDEIELLAASINRMSHKLEEAHLALEEKNQNLRNFISDISHELKTPIALIKAYSSGIRDEMDDGTFLSVIDKKTDEMSQLVDKLLHLAKLQNEIYAMEYFDFKALLGDVLDNLEVAIQKEQKIIEVDNSQLHHPIVRGDQQKIRIVLDNFITNALKYASGPQIDISLVNEGERLVFTIRNGFRTLDEQDVNHIWQPFFVLDHSRNKKLSGSGLGLSIVQVILDKHEAPHGIHAKDQEIAFYFSLAVGSE